MDALILSRIQFGISVGFHFIFPSVTLGLTFFIVIFESLYVFKKDELYKNISVFLVKILAPVFAMGVATGLLLPIAFGANWARFSIFASDIFGFQLAMEALVAFALESAFLGVLLFGRNKVSSKFYLISAFLVFLGAHISAFWIISANSFMHTPAGFIVENGKIVITNLFAALFNPSTMIRFVHTVTATWLCGSIVTGAFASYFLLKNKFIPQAKKMLFISAIFIITMPFLQILWGHTHIMEVLEHNPVKEAAYEGNFKTQKGAPLILFGLPDYDNDEIKIKIGIPNFLSFLESGDFDSEVKGLEEYPEETHPPVNIIFTSFHIMVPIGFILAGIGIAAFILLLMKRLYDFKLFQRVLLFSIPLPFIAIEFGWIGTEIGRQPWTVYGLLKTADSTSQIVNTGNLIFSLTSLSLIYIFLSIIFTKIIINTVKSGFESKKTEDK